MMAFKQFKFVNKKGIFSKKIIYYSASTAITLETKGEVISTARPWKVVFFGTDEFSLGSLSRLNEELKTNAISKLEVVSSKWHLNPVRLFGQKEGLVVHEWPLEPQAIQDCDIGLVASFGYLIPKRIIDVFPLGMLNVHGSLLPRWRGAAPVNYAVMYGDTVTGVSIMRVRPYRFDCGEIISTREVAIAPSETAVELRARLGEIGGEELISCVRKLPKSLEHARPQPEDGICYAPKITPDLGLIKFENMTAKCIYDRFRALYGVVPVSTTWMGMKVTFHELALENTRNCGQNQLHVTSFEPSEGCVPGQIHFDRRRKQLVVKCCDNSNLLVKRIAPFRKKPISAIEFYNGYLSKQNKIDWLFS